MNRLTTKKPHQLKIKFPKTARFEPLHLPKPLQVDNLKHHRHCVGMACTGKIRDREYKTAYQRVLDMIIAGYLADRLRRKRIVEMLIAGYNAERFRRVQWEKEKTP